MSRWIQFNILQETLSGNKRVFSRNRPFISVFVQGEVATNGEDRFCSTCFVVSSILGCVDVESGVGLVTVDGKTGDIEVRRVFDCQGFGWKELAGKVVRRKVERGKRDH